MTKDRGRKQAARQRAAQTGERYVVARRQAADVPSPEGGVLHALTHRMPGVPVHVDGRLQARRRRERSASTPRQPRRHTQPQYRQPRVLIGWQNRIARLFGAY